MFDNLGFAYYFMAIVGFIVGIANAIIDDKVDKKYQPFSKRLQNIKHQLLEIKTQQRT